MARSRTVSSTPAPQTVTVDAIDNLVTKLNTISGLAFVRDAWENKAPENYGVVELNGQSSALWADDAMVGQIFQVSVHLYAKGGSNTWIYEIQQKIAEAVDGYNMPTHEFLYDINKNHWTWNCWMVGPLQWEETAPGVSLWPDGS